MLFSINIFYHNLVLNHILMEIQIVSDVHTEFWGNKSPFKFVAPGAKVLALLGDIGVVGQDKDFESYKRFIEEVAPMYEHIFVITGNHEYYTNNLSKKTLKDVDQILVAYFKKYKHIHFLNNKTVDVSYDNVQYKIIGSTLWSHIPAEHCKEVKQSMTDYEKIHTDISKLDPAYVSQMFTHNYNFIKKKIDQAKKENRRAIVFTHHKPYLDGRQMKAIDHAYMSDCSALFQDHVVLWAYGHTHIRDDRFIGKTRLFSNCKGYPNQRTGYVKKESIKC